MTMRKLDLTGVRQGGNTEAAPEDDGVGPHLADVDPLASLFTVVSTLELSALRNNAVCKRRRSIPKVALLLSATLIPHGQAAG